MKTVIVVISVILINAFLLTGNSYGDSAEVLPKGVSRAILKSKFYFTIDKKYNEDGDTEDIAEDFNASLNSNIFPALELVENGFGMSPGSANVGDSLVSFEYDANAVEFFYYYGLADRLTVGIKIPYWDFKNNVDAGLDTTNATVGKTQIGSNVGIPIAPFGTFPDTVPLTADDVQNLLGPGLDTNGDGTIDISGYGYDYVKTWSGSGLSDIEAGGRYQYYKSDNWRLAFTGVVRFPTGKEDDQDDLTDYPFGTGTYAILFHLNNDYTGINNLVLNATFQYEWYLSNDEKLRIPLSVDRPVTANKEKVDRDLGDIFKLETSGLYKITEGLSFLLLYKYAHRKKNKVDGDMGYNYSSLEDETNFTEHVLTTALTYSTLPKYLKKEFPVPMAVSLGYRNRFAGKNNVLKSQYVLLMLQFFFK